MNLYEVLEPMLFIIGIALCIASSLFIREIPQKKEREQTYDLDRN